MCVTTVNEKEDMGTYECILNIKYVNSDAVVGGWKL